MENFRRFAPSVALFCPIFCNKLKIFGTSRHLRLYFAQFFVKKGKFLALRAIWNMLWRFSMVLAWKNREEIGIFWFQKGEKSGTFGQNIYPCPARWERGSKIMISHTSFTKLNRYHSSKWFDYFTRGWRIAEWDISSIYWKAEPCQIRFFCLICKFDVSKFEFHLIRFWKMTVHLRIICN